MPGTFTYDPSDLTTELAQVRLRLGDTDDNNPLLYDEEIEHYLGLVGDNVVVAAHRCCRLVLAKLGRETDSDGAGVRSSRSQKVQHYRDILKLLEQEMLAECKPILTGATKSERTTLDDDSDWPGTFFDRNMGRYPGT